MTPAETPIFLVYYYRIGRRPPRGLHHCWFVPMGKTFACGLLDAPWMLIRDLR